MADIRSHPQATEGVGARASERRGGSGPSPLGTLTNALGLAGSATVFLVMMLIFADVVARNLFNAPIQGVAELVAAAVVAIVFLQLPSTVRHDRMARAEAFVLTLSMSRPRVGAALLALYDLCGAGVLGMLTWTLSKSLHRAWIDGTFIGSAGVFTMPTWPLYAIVVAGTGLCTLQYGARIIGQLKVIATGASRP